MIKPVFIVGRFRSGTSFFWQIFDRLDGFCAWYEPLHPELLTAINHVPPKDDHVGVTDYWKIYRDNPSFADQYAMDFATRKLYLEPQDSYPALLKYIRHLIALSGDQTPVLQFNRADLRLGWLRQHFPEAIIIHLERNPLQLYYSQRKHIEDERRHDFSHWDAYELLPWCCALNESFPMLLKHQHEHAFYGFYGLYRLAQVLARNWSSISIQLEADVFESDDYLIKLQQVLSLTPDQLATIRAIKHIPDTPVFSFQEVETMSQMMTEVDLELAASGLLEHLGQRTLESIQFHHADYWQNANLKAVELETLRNTWKAAQNEVNRVSEENLQLNPNSGSLINQQQPSDIKSDLHLSRDLAPSQQAGADESVAHYLLQINKCRNQLARALEENRTLRSSVNES